MPYKIIQTSETVVLSRQKWIIVGLIITILNPLFAGLIYGLALWREPSFKKEGRLIAILSLFWGAIQLAFFARYY
jgi:hypothetical protein